MTVGSTSFDQFVYTSAPGVSRSGYRIVASSTPVAEVAFEMDIRSAGYRPPWYDSAPPSDTDLAGFPPSLVVSETDGRVVIARSVPTGADHYGRPGNYLIHAIHGPLEAFVASGLRPLELWESSMWLDVAPESTEMPVVRQLEPGLLVLDDRVRTALDAEWDAVVDLASASINRVDGSGPTVILRAATATDGAILLAAMHQLLPASLAWQIGLTSFTGEPSTAVTPVVGTTAVVPVPHRVTVGQGFTLFDFSEGSTPATRRPELLELVGGLDADGSRAVMDVADRLGQDPTSPLGSWTDPVLAAMCHEGFEMSDAEASRVMNLLESLNEAVPAEHAETICAELLEDHAGTRTSLVKVLEIASRSGAEEVLRATEGRALRAITSAEPSDIVPLAQRIKEIAWGESAREDAGRDIERRVQGSSPADAVAYLVLADSIRWTLSPGALDSLAAALVEAWRPGSPQVRDLASSVPTRYLDAASSAVLAALESRLIDGGISDEDARRMLVESGFARSCSAQASTAVPMASTAAISAVGSVFADRFKFAQALGHSGLTLRVHLRCAEALWSDYPLAADEFRLLAKAVGQGQVMMADFDSVARGVLLTGELGPAALVDLLDTLDDPSCRKTLRPETRNLVRDGLFINAALLDARSSRGGVTRVQTKEVLDASSTGLVRTLEPLMTSLGAYLAHTPWDIQARHLPALRHRKDVLRRGYEAEVRAEVSSANTLVAANAFVALVHQAGWPQTPDLPLDALVERSRAWLVEPIESLGRKHVRAIGNAIEDVRVGDDGRSLAEPDIKELWKRWQKAAQGDFWPGGRSSAKRRSKR